MPARLELWIVDLHRDGPLLAELAVTRGVLSPADRERHAAYRDSADARDFAASRAALDLVLEAKGAAPGTRLSTTRSGKPFVPGLPQFSLSRTQGYAAIGVVSEGAVGIDIEAARSIGSNLPLIDSVAGILQSRRPATVEPLDAWTLIEAWCKLRGITLAALIDSPAIARELEYALESRMGYTALPLPSGIRGHCCHDAPDVELHPRTLILP